MITAIDLFCGWGGFTEGAFQAGVNVTHCVDIDELSLEVHRLNYPETHTHRTDAREVIGTLPASDLMLASPPCQGHSRASRPHRRDHHIEQRSLMWSVNEYLRGAPALPKALVIENVREVARWDEFGAWTDDLRRLGYHLHMEITRAQWHGVPQRRERLMVIGTRPKPILFHMPTWQNEVPYRTCIDEYGDAWRDVEGAAPYARERIYRAHSRFGSELHLVSMTKGETGASIDEPIRTLTTKQSMFALVQWPWYRYLTMREYLCGMGFPPDYLVPDGVSKRNWTRGIGNAVCPPVARGVIQAVLKWI